MKEKIKRSIKKISPVGIAMGIVFSFNPFTKHKAKADVDTRETILTTFGATYDTFLKEPFVIFLSEQSAKNDYTANNENRAYKAPTFNKGEFGISVYDYYKNQNFSKRIKIFYKDGKVEYKTIKHGQQLLIKQAGIIVDLNPDASDLYERDVYYITQKQLDEGTTGIALTNWQTYYLKSDNSDQMNGPLALKYIRQEFPNIKPGNASFDLTKLFHALPEGKRKLATITSNPVKKSEIFSYTSDELAEIKRHKLGVVTQHKNEECPSISMKIRNRDNVLRTWEDSTNISASSNWIPKDRSTFTIIPIEKGSNKVYIEANAAYLTSTNGEVGVTGFRAYGQVWTLVNYGFESFSLKNNHGQYLSVNDTSVCLTDKPDKNTIFSITIQKDKWNEWLAKWYSSK
ncbi:MULTISPECIES: hypothetical protein [Bacillus cereus group]|uniref:hypothetical protein n=1 Tax=Bacillus cereus group TaxID=86661 RepID=UPI000BECD0D8|nr:MULTISPECIES: hypothetical protein [Bacillus cereus group]PEA72977.1 hypothetical protein COO00_08685 [Bacillus toyonensis]PEL75916.1 hypothetical protein CN609_26865 [Bacillus wiedmannii]PFW89027.1 hypothetical protein COL33_22785 [Bacillus toyonensis]PHB05548.1 hypothetical protein COE81_16880 [Bacillus wiedmannii]PHF64291.1 hypothetical protein COI52_30510 [Bacillus toyonensis]